MTLFQRVFHTLQRFSISLWLALRHKLSSRPSLDLYRSRMLKEAPESPGKLRVTFFGVSSLLFDDGETAILTDGFLSRPGRFQTLLTKIKPDQDVIDLHLARPGFEHLKAVIVLHSHYDHSFDAPLIAAQKNADLIGSESTRMISEGYGLKNKFHSIEEGQPITYGRFTITLLASKHSEITLLSHFGIHKVLLHGKVNHPIRPPACWTDYKEGGSYSLLIQHDKRSMLVQASAGFLPGALEGHQAELVFLGVGTLGKMDDKSREDYWREVVETVGARRVIPIHWDDFFRPLDQPLAPMPRVADDFGKTMEFLRARGGETVEVKLIPELTVTDPFADLDKS